MHPLGPIKKVSNSETGVYIVFLLHQAYLAHIAWHLMQRGMKQASTAFRLLVLVAFLLPLQARSAERPGSAEPYFQMVVAWPLELPQVLQWLPEWLVVLLGVDYAATVSVDAGFPGTRIPRLDERHVELRHREGLELLVEHAADGWVTAGTRLVLAPKLSDRPQKLRCRPKTVHSGYWLAYPPAESGKQQGRFAFLLATCEEEGTGKIVDWPRRPIFVKGTFSGLPAASHLP